MSLKLLYPTYMFMYVNFIIEFEEMAANVVKAERHISPGEAQAFWRFIQDHGDDYKVLQMILCCEKDC